MIRGTVSILGREGPIILWEPRIEVAVSGTDMNFQTLEVVVDTGFTGALALPDSIIQELGLTYQGQRQIRLATGRQSVYIYGAVVSWFGDLRAVLVHQVDGNPLVGNALLTNCLLTIDFREGGEVNIRPHWLDTGD